MKYQSILDRISLGQYARSELARLRINALEKVASGDGEAAEVIRAIDEGKPSDQYIIFMGFCPGADFANRKDKAWKEAGICTFEFFDSTHQLERFESIWAGDRLVLKKRHEFGKSMKLYGHGRVAGVEHDQQGKRYLNVDWSMQERVIEVPLMGCNSTVDVKSIEQIEAEMPREFFEWLED